MGGGAGIAMLIQLIVSNNAVITQHGTELVRVNERVEDIAHLSLLNKAHVARLDAKVVGRGPDGFHKQDWERERRVFDAQLSQVNIQLRTLKQGVYDCTKQLNPDVKSGMGGMSR